MADAVNQELAIRSGPTLPPGVNTVRSFYDQSQLVRDSIKSVRDAILLGLIFRRDHFGAVSCAIGATSIVAGLVIPATVAITFDGAAEGVG